jgi:endonuclease YncB( thermonuclease family)
MLAVQRTIPAVVIAVAMILAPGVAQAACDLENAGKATIVEILNPETLVLEDGRTVRLVGLFMPPTQTRWARTMGIRKQLMAALKERLLGQKVRLRLGGRKRDRYGRLLAHVFVIRQDADQWIQQAFVAQGRALAISFPDNKACARRLQHAEHRARKQGAGLWKEGLFRVRDASDPASMQALSNTFQIVEGTVRDVAAKRKRIYINFGEDWRTDFTATIAPSDRDRFADSGINPADLAGRTVRVRGWLKQRNGPIIALTHPEQIEIISTQSGMVHTAESSMDAGRAE